MTAILQGRATVKQAAKLMNVSERSVYMARAVQRLRPDLAIEVDEGRMSLNEAHRLATGKPKATSWERLVRAWNNATPEERTQLLARATE